MGLEQIVNVSISRQTQAVSQAGFGIPMILSTNAAFSGTVKTYLSTDDVLVDFTSSQDEYKAAVKLFGQTPKPTKIKIGKALSKVAQVDTITPTAVNTTHYIVTIDGVAYDYTSDGSATVSEIVAGLISLINADSAAQATATGTTTLILTAKTAGHPFVTSVNANQVLVHTTANVGVVESLAAIKIADNDWYGLVSTFRADNDVLQIAAYIEPQLKIFGFSTNASGVKDGSSTTDIAYKLKAASYFRTWVLYSGDTANYPEAALFGRCLPTTPGSETWAFKTLAGVTVDNLDGTAITALEAKNCGYYTPYGGKNITLSGKVAGGEFIDIIRLIDLIASRMEENVFSAVSTPDKLPMTNGGISVVENECQGVLKANQKSGGVAPDEVDSDGNLVKGFSTSFPKVSDIASADRKNRTISGTWQARLAGAIHAVNISGTVTV